MCCQQSNTASRQSLYCAAHFKTDNSVDLMFSSSSAVSDASPKGCFLAMRSIHKLFLTGYNQWPTERCKAFHLHYIKIQGFHAVAVQSGIHKTSPHYCVPLIYWWVYCRDTIVWSFFVKDEFNIRLWCQPENQRGFYVELSLCTDAQQS